MRGERFAAFILILSSCTGAPQPEPLDGGRATDAGPRGQLEVGTGIIAFEPIAETDVLALVPGPQGGGRFDGHHIWMSLRLAGRSPDEAASYAVHTLDADREPVASLERVVGDVPFERDDDGRWILPGLAPRLSDCCRVSSRPVVLQATLALDSGERLTAEAVASAGACSVECP